MASNGSLLDEHRGQALLDVGLQQIYINVGEEGDDYEEVYKLPFDDIVTDRDLAVIRRGPIPLDARTFDISACYSDRARQLVVPLRETVVP